MSKIKYLLDSGRKLIGGKQFTDCPSCKNSESMIVDRKYFVTTLHRCAQCQLLFRVPVTTEVENESFYQEEYSQGFTTDVPSDSELKQLIESSFADTPKDYTTYIKILESVGAEAGQKLFDFGCSWGYGSYQFQQYGFDVKSFEISRPRARYAKEKLNVDVDTSLDAVDGSYDIFFSAHVLEHVPSVDQSVALGLKLLKPGGIFIAFTPNGSDGHKEANFQRWHQMWGAVHPNYLDKEYYQKAFDGFRYLLASNPYNFPLIENWWKSTEVSKVLDLSGNELLVIAVKK